MMETNLNDYGSRYLIRDQKIKSSTTKKRLKWILCAVITIMLLITIAMILFYVITLRDSKGDIERYIQFQKSKGIKTTDNSTVGTNSESIEVMQSDSLPLTSDNSKSASTMVTTSTTSTVTATTPFSTIAPTSTTSTVTGATPVSTMMIPTSKTSTVTGTTPVSTMIPTSTTSNVTGTTPVSTIAPTTTTSTVTGTTPFSTIAPTTTTSTVTGKTPFSTMVHTSITSTVTGTTTTPTVVPTTDVLTALCDVKIKPLGCYADIRSNHSMEMILDSHRGDNEYYHGVSIDWNNFGHSLKLLLCDCVIRAKDKGMNYIGLQFYGECWGSKVPTYNKYGISTRCVDSKFKACYFKNNQDICVGEANTNYVYKTGAAERI